MRIVFRSSGDPSRQQMLGPYVIESLIDRTEEGAGTVYRVAIAPNCVTSTSYHARAEEYYFVLRGAAVAKLDGVDHPLHEGDFLRLPPGTTHAFTTGEEGVELLNVHTPGCFPDRDTFFVDETPDGFGAP